MIAVIHTHRVSCILADGPWCLATLMVILALWAGYGWWREMQTPREENTPDLSAEEWARSLSTDALAAFVNSDWSALDGPEKDAIWAEHMRRQATEHWRQVAVHPES